ncbi:hypothetical protein VIGAN_08302000 [Vigna angularis var. angularis]|uniref:Uncharacterized protein n=1 Tax=Vigna angularis var. angularis TaxID=157739 RepID=A0A0S3STI5_PHAAN|nr:hypothetical protein VIGAN_08302000 [Vigna angularis var. angularis]
MKKKMGNCGMLVLLVMLMISKPTTLAELSSEGSLVQHMKPVRLAAIDVISGPRPIPPSIPIPETPNPIALILGRLRHTDLKATMLRCPSLTLFSTINNLSHLSLNK